ncbi:Poly [ADP-ribose] polymerase 2 [Rhizophlyctis rosea]|nr:Poly [ADP-ribose] polymerase 2 [Rhizophlyctis rosea]
MPPKRKATTPVKTPAKSRKQQPESTAPESIGPPIIKVLETKTARRTERAFVSRGGPKPLVPEWIALEDVPSNVLEDFEKNGNRKDIVEKIVRGQSVRGKQMCLVKFVGLEGEGWLSADSEYLTEDIVNAYHKADLQVHTIHEHRVEEATNQTLYFVTWRRPEAERIVRKGVERPSDLPKEWVKANQIQKDVLDAYHETQRKITDAYAEIRSRNAAVGSWLAKRQKHPVPDCCATCWVKQLKGAVENEDEEGVRTLIEVKGGFSFGATQLPFEACAATNNVRILTLLLKMSSSFKEAQSVSAAYRLSDEYIMSILGPERDWPTTVPSFALSSLRAGQLRNATICFKLMIDRNLQQTAIDTTKTVVPKDGPFTLLHYQALTATKVSDVTEKCTEMTVNAGSLGIYLTPLHCAAMNPCVDVYKMMVKKGGDVGLDDVDGRFPVHYAALVGDWNGMGEETATPSPTLMYILSQEDVDAKKSELVLHGIIGSYDRYGNTQVSQSPLMRALRAGQYGNVKVLVEHVARLAKGQYGDVPGYWEWPLQLIDAAVEMKRPEVFDAVCELLPLDYHYKWSTALESALRNGDVATFLYILARNIPPKRSQLTADEAVKEDPMEVEEEENDNEPQDADDTHKPSLLETCIDTLLLTAIASQCLPIVRLLLGFDRDTISHIVDANIDVSTDFDGKPYLRTAVENGFGAGAELLVQKGAKPHLVDENGCSLLMAATRRGHPSCVRVLIAAGVDVNAKRDDVEEQTATNPADLTALQYPFRGMVFCSTGILKWSNYAISSIIERLGGRYVGQYSSNVTHCLCGRDGRNEWNQKTGKGSTKYKECKKRKLPFVDEAWIEAAQAKVPRVQSHAAQIELEVIGTVLHDMMQHMDFTTGDTLETLRYLIDCGADVNALDDDDRTPLHYLVYYRPESQCLPVMDILLDAMEASPSNAINQQDIKDAEYTAIQVAAARNKWRFVERLLSAGGIDIYRPFPTVFRPISTPENAVPFGVNRPIFGHPMPTPPSSPHHVIKETVGEEPMAVPHARSGRTLLHLAAKEVFRNVMHKLIDMYIADGKDINIRELWWDQLPVVHHLVAYPDDHFIESLKYLMKAPGFDVNARNAKGETILHLMLHRNHNEILNLLERIWACGLNLDLTVADNKGEMAIHFAAANAGHGLLLRVLLEKYPHHLNIPTKAGLTPLAKALMAHNQGAAFYLLEKGADMNIKCHGSSPPPPKKTFGFGTSVFGHTAEDKGARGSSTTTTAFAYCTSQPDLTAVLEWMMRQDGLDVEQSLLAAHKAGRVDLAHRLFQKSGPAGTRTAAEIAGKLIHMLLLSAPGFVGGLSMVKELYHLQQTEEKKMKLLMEYSQESSTKGWTIMQVAWLRRHFEIFEYLLNQIPSPGDVHIVLGLPSKSQKLNILHYQAKKNDELSADNFLTHMKKATGSEIIPYISIPDGDGNTPLHYAVTPDPAIGCRMQSTELVKKLLQAGANPLVPDAAGRSVARIVGRMGGEWWNELKAVIKSQSHFDPVAIESELSAGQEERMARERREQAEFAAQLKDVEARIKKRQKHLESVQAMRAERASKQAEEQSKHADELDVPVDRQFGDSDYEVVIDSGDIWDTCLTCVDIGHNIFGKNKYYNIQLLVNRRLLEAERNPQPPPPPPPQPVVVEKPKKMGRLARKLAREAAQRAAQQAQAEERAVQAVLRKPRYQVYTRWGRMGGQSYGGSQYRYGGYGYGKIDHEHGGSKKESFEDLEEAKKTFCAKFKEKTKNEWEARNSFVRYQGLYTYHPRYYRKKADTKTINATAKQDFEKGALDSSVAKLMNLITDEGEMYRDISAFGLDAQRLPAGQLSLKQIHEGYTLLQQMSDTIHGITIAEGYRGNLVKEGTATAKKLKQDLQDLCNAFYELIPFDFGLERPDLIDDLTKVRAKFDMLDVMSDVAEAMDVVRDAEKGNDKLTKVERVYNELGCDISPLPSSDPRYRMITDYISNTSASGAGAGKIKNVFQVQRLEEISNFQPYVENRKKFTEDDEGIRPNNLLLFHGSRVSNAVGILSKGLKIAPPEAPQTGLMFGKGVYFADAFSKSRSYCHGHTSKLMFLCEVAVGECTSLTSARYMESPIGHTTSTKGMGKSAPARSGWAVSPDGVGVPMGQLVPVPEAGRTGYLVEFD